MTRTLQLTPAEVAAWADVPEGGTFWLVRDGVEDDLDQFIREENLPVERGLLHPPAVFVQACAPCEVCTGTRHLHPAVSGDLHPMPCQVCRIELSSSHCTFQTCEGCCSWRRTRAHRRTSVFCPGYGAEIGLIAPPTVILGFAYAVGQPLPIIRGWSRPDGNSSGDVLSVWKGHYGPDLVMQRAWNATAIQTQYADRTAALAHYGPPESLVGKWALQVQVLA